MCEYFTAAAKSLQSCLTLCDPIDGSPPGSLGFSRQEHWSGLPFSSPMHESESEREVSRSVVSDSLRPSGLQSTRLLRPWDFSRQEYWSGVPSPSPEYFTTTVYSRGNCPSHRLEEKSAANLTHG